MSRTSTTSMATNDAAARGAQGAVDARARGGTGGPTLGVSSDARGAGLGPNARITAEVLSWPGMDASTGRRGEWSFKLDRREIGHLHGDTTAHFGFAKDVWRELHAAGRIDFHPVFPGKEGPAARRIAGPDDERDVIALLRLNYDRLTAPDQPEPTASA